MPYGVFLGSVCGDQVGQLAIITRTNFTLFAEAATLCSSNDQVFKNIKIAFAGGFESLGYKMILDIFALLTEGTEANRGGC